MRITVKNNPKDRASKAEVKEATEYFLTKLIGKDKVNGLSNINVTFKKLTARRGGYVRIRNNDYVNQRIFINSRQTKKDIFRVLAHECTHVKQLFLKELRYERKLKLSKTSFSSRMQHTTIWKGKRIIRSNYRKRAWEVEARKFESMATNLTAKLKRFNNGASIKEEPKQKPVSNMQREIILELLKDRDILNGNLVNLVIKENSDKQYRIKVLKEVFAMKESGMIEQYYNNSVAWIRKK